MKSRVVLFMMMAGLITLVVAGPGMASTPKEIFQRYKASQSQGQNQNILKSIYFSEKFGAVFDSVSIGRYVYIVGGYGLAVMDFSDTAAPRMVKNIKSPLELNDIVVDGNYAYITAGRRGSLRGRLVVMDVSRPENPRRVSTLELPESPVGLVVQEGIAYLGGYSSGFFIIDVKNPSRPRMLSTFVPAEQGRIEKGKVARLLDSGMDIPDALIAKAGKRIGVRNEDDARRWAELKQLKGHVWWPNVRYPYAYVPYDPEGLYVLDITDPAKPKQVGYFNKKTKEGGDLYFNDVAFYRNYALIALDYAGFLVLDISDPAKPREVAHVNPWPGHTWESAPGHMIQLKVFGDRAYFPAGEDGVYIYDIKDPIKPVLIEKVPGSLEQNKGLAWGMNVTHEAVTVGYIPFKTNPKAKGGFEVYQLMR